MKSNLEVALVKELCPVCLAEITGPIIMNTVLTKSDAEKVKELNGKVIGYADDICDNCKKNIIDEDGIYLIEVDLSKTDNKNNPYRTGNIIAIKRDVLVNMGIVINHDNPPYSFIDKSDLKLLMGEHYNDSFTKNDN